MSSLFYIAIGATAGAWFRFLFDVLLNPIFPTLPLGTLLVNLVGSYMIGLVMGAGILSEILKLTLVTGFLGGMTTFSTFSYEVVSLFLRQEYFWAIVQILLQVFGSLILTFLGYLTINFFQAT